MTTYDNEYDAPEKVQARKDQEDPWVMYLIVRESLNMSTGKTAAQVGHAVGMMCRIYYLIQGKLGTWNEKETIRVSNYMNWENESFRKIVLKADDKEWKKLKEQCECFVVRDAGLTEVAAGSETVIGLWPTLKSNAPKLVRKLQVLK